MRKDRKQHREVWLLPGLFLYAISLFNLSGHLFAGLAAVFLGRNLHRVRLAFPEVLLLLFSVSYFGIWSVHYGFRPENVVLFLSGPWAAFLLGKGFVETSPKENAYLAFLTVLSAGMFAHGVLNWGAYFWSDAYAVTYAYYRISIDIWRGTVVSVTASGMFFTFAAGMALGCLFSDAAPKRKRAAFAVLAVCLAVTVFYANKTLLYIILLITGWKLLPYCLCRKVQKNAGRGKLLTAAVILAGILVLFLTNAGGFGDWLRSLKLVKRLLQEDNSSRFILWLHFFRDWAFLRHPFGGGGIASSYLHNLWLDTYNAVGFFPGFLLLVFTLWALGRLHAFARSAHSCGREAEHSITQCLLAAFFLNAMVEPVLEANPYFFLTALMFLGAMEGRLRTLRGKAPAAGDVI